MGGGVLIVNVPKVRLHPTQALRLGITATSDKDIATGTAPGLHMRSIKASQIMKPIAADT